MSLESLNSQLQVSLFALISLLSQCTKDNSVLSHTENNILLLKCQLCWEGWSQLLTIPSSWNSRLRIDKGKKLLWAIRRDSDILQFSMDHHFLFLLSFVLKDSFELNTFCWTFLNYKWHLPLTSNGSLLLFPGHSDFQVEIWDSCKIRLGWKYGCNF